MPLEIVSAYLYPGNQHEIFQTHSSLTPDFVGIVYADIVDSARLSGNREVNLEPRLNEAISILTTCVSARSGRLVGIGGNALLTEFTDVNQALGSAMTMQLAARQWNSGLPLARQMMFRICLSYGDSVFTRQPTDISFKHLSAYRDRLALTGNMCISEIVLEILDDHLDLKLVAAGKQFLKCFQKPVDAFWIEVDTDRFSG